MIDLIRRLPDKKRYFELVTAFLSIPVLLSVIVMNYSNISGTEDTSASVSEPYAAVQEISVTYIPVESPDVAGDRTEEYEEDVPEPTVVEEEISVSPGQDICIKSVGPIEIRAPQQGEIVNSNPVNVTVDYTVGEYCAVVWSYRINEGDWSDFDDKSIALFDLTSGTKHLELRVRSIASRDEKMVDRTFIYQPFVSPTPLSTATPIPTITQASEI